MLRKIFTFLALFLIGFIPLYPKLPLLQIIPNYIVRVRWEDVIMAVTVALLGWFVLKGKAKIKTPLNKYIWAYLLVGAISLFSAFFIIKTLPLLFWHVGKAVLHYLRYIEYFSFFFVIFASFNLTKNSRQRHLTLLINVLLVTLVLAVLYGMGQKYFEWPVFSTMSYEYSQGIPLELVSQAARVQSTFAGHYDFSIFSALVLPLVLLRLYLAKERKWQVIFATVFVLGLWGLIASSLRIAFVAYVVEVTLMTVLMALRQQRWLDKVKWAAVRLLFVYAATAVMFVFFGSNLLQLLETATHGFHLQSQQSAADLIVDQYEVPVPVDPNLRPTLQNKDQIVLSECAKRMEISLCIRLESLWPQAWKGFLRQPLVGSGYSSLNKKDFYDLAQADGTDGNYLRILGETGILGFITFFSIIVAACLFTTKFFWLKDENIAFLSMCYVSIVVGILINASLFDVFAASKVAFTFWAITGMVLCYEQKV